VFTENNPGREEHVEEGLQIARTREKIGFRISTGPHFPYVMFSFIKVLLWLGKKESKAR
jgi:hypothetical protein